MKEWIEHTLYSSCLLKSHKNCSNDLTCPKIHKDKNQTKQNKIKKTETKNWERNFGGYKANGLMDLAEPRKVKP